VTRAAVCVALAAGDAVVGEGLAIGAAMQAAATRPSSARI
jgi:F0F1-type ATP synthase membrane subunit c/vacuolar-type H+-ATPase subunit K